MLSKTFLERIERHRPFHKLAWASGLSPNQLYKITAGIDRPGPDDPRIKRLAEHFGMNLADCFEDDGGRGVQ